VADDEHCPVCQFLAQSVILVSIHKDVDWENLREKATVAEPIGRLLAFSSNPAQSCSPFCRVKLNSY